MNAPVPRTAIVGSVIVATLLVIGCSSSGSDANETAGEDDGPDESAGDAGGAATGSGGADASTDKGDGDDDGEAADDAQSSGDPDGADVTSDDDAVADEAVDGDGDGDTSDDGSTMDGDDPPDEGTLDDPPLTPCDFPIPPTSQLPRLLNYEYDAAIRDLLGVTTLEAAAGGPPSALLQPDFDGPMTSPAWQAYFNAAESIAVEVMAGDKASRFIECDPAESKCLTETIETFGRKAFRRPLTDEEVERFMGLADVEPPGTPQQTAETILFGFLASPSFIMLPELVAEEESPGVLLLSSHEVAARLALLLWGSVPDDELNAAADAGELVTPEEISAQAERMIADREKTGYRVIAAHRAYADVNDQAHWGKIMHDSAETPAYSSPEEVVPAMMAELDAFFEEVGSEGTFEQLFTNNVGFVNEALAPIYGLDAADFGSELSRVEFDPDERPGFLTRVAFLSSYSAYSSTSPILRGAYISRLMGLDPGPHAPDMLVGSIPAGDWTTNRQKMEDLMDYTSECRGCHDTINPAGYVLEVYDSVGGVQTIDPLGGEIDATADVSLPEGESATITSPRELMETLAALPEARRIYAEKLVYEATRRAPNDHDDCIVEAFDEMLADGYPSTSLFVDLARRDSLRLRVQEE
jgi:hypothetical protein